MKHKHLTFMLAVLMSMVANVASAYDFEEAGIYYHITSSTNKTVEVVSCPFYELDNEYSGSVTIPKSVSYNNTTYSVTEIGSDAFRACSLLTSISIPNSVTEIGSDAFVYCSGLTSIAIPNSVTKIGQGAFNGCSGLTSIIVNSDNVTFDSRNNCNAIIETSSNTLIVGCKNTNIPNNVAKIGSDAFSECTELTSITIPNSVTEIGPRAFSGCI